MKQRALAISMTVAVVVPLAVHLPMTSVVLRLPFASSSPLAARPLPRTGSALPTLLCLTGLAMAEKPRTAWGITLAL